MSELDAMLAKHSFFVRRAAIDLAVARANSVVPLQFLEPDFPNSLFRAVRADFTRITAETP